MDIKLLSVLKLMYVFIWTAFETKFSWNIQKTTRLTLFSLLKKIEKSCPILKKIGFTHEQMCMAVKHIMRFVAAIESITCVLVGSMFVCGKTSAINVRQSWFHRCDRMRCSYVHHCVFRTERVCVSFSRYGNVKKHSHTHISRLMVRSTFDKMRKFEISSALDE